jgi:hypothetical protein
MNAMARLTPLKLVDAAVPSCTVRTSMLIARTAATVAFRTSAALACLALAACGGTSDITPSPARDACTVAAVMVPIRAALDTADTQATVEGNNGDLKCVAGVARITVLLGAVSAPSDGPQGSPHLVLLEDDAGSWVVANDRLCAGTGPSTRPIPPELGEVCGVQ